MKVDFLDGTSNRRNILVGSDFTQTARNRLSTYRAHVLPGAKNTLTLDELVSVLVAASTCAYCGIALQAKNISVDHIVPLVRGGDPPLFTG